MSDVPGPLFRPPRDAAEARYVGLLRVGDPPADALAEGIAAGAVDFEAVERALVRGSAADDPPALRAFLDALALPLWADPARMRRGGEALRRTGILGGVVLALYALPLGYLSPAGVKPLVLSGRLVEAAPRRLSETNRFLYEVCQPDGLTPGAPGFVVIAKVRLMHAQVRRRLQATGLWQAGWGSPINQAHLSGTGLLFSLHALDGLRAMGARFSAAEVEGYLHLWDVAGHLLGITPELRCPTEAAARRLWGIIRRVEGPPGAESRALARALVEQAVPRVLGALLPGVPFEHPQVIERLEALSATLLGPEYAAALGLSSGRAPPRVVPLVRALVGGLEAVQARSAAGRAALLAAGSWMNDQLVEAALGGEPAAFRE
ncbi:MAG: DUF2236 domain-containing protein [Alphaproteobacteria bacterium]|nr:DUF2236 domain-containing protein [Alphaproteobacteria bacterium]